MAVVLQVSTVTSLPLLLCTPNHWASAGSERFLVFRYMPGSVYASPVLGCVLVIGRLIIGRLCGDMGAAGAHHRPYTTG